MSEELHKCLINYFSQLEKVDCKWKELSKEAERPLHGLKNQSEQLRLVVRKDVDNLELCYIEELRERLTFKIFKGIHDEMILLYDVLTRFNNVNQDLRNRLRNLENARSKVSLSQEIMKKLINGTPYRPRLDLLLEWANHVFNYYHNLYVLINVKLKEVDYRDEDTFQNLTRSFVEDRFKRARIDRILASTEFLAQETIR